MNPIESFHYKQYVKTNQGNQIDISKIQKTATVSSYYRQDMFLSNTQIFKLSGLEMFIYKITLKLKYYTDKNDIMINIDLKYGRNITKLL